jgi:hypothetical protein
VKNLFRGTALTLLALGLAAGLSAARAGASIVRPVTAAAHPAAAQSAARKADAVKPLLADGDSYRIEDYGGLFGHWDGTYRAVLTVQSHRESAFVVKNHKTVAGSVYYQFALGKECMEYDNAAGPGKGTGEVIADTCDKHRAAQWWWWDDEIGQGVWGTIQSLYDGCSVVANGNGSGSVIYCTSSPQNYSNAESLWYIYRP